MEHRMRTASRVATIYATALLGLWLIVGITAFPGHAAIWIAFGTAIAIAVVAGASVPLAFLDRRWLSGILGVASFLLAAFLIAAALVFKGASADWLMAISGGALELASLTGLAVPRLRVHVVREQRSEERPEERERYAA